MVCFGGLGKLVCPQGHTLQHMVNSRLMTTQVGYVSGYVCDRCHQSSQLASDSVYHCDQCHFDLCEMCAQIVSYKIVCPQGHHLQPTTHTMLCQETTEYSHGYLCDQCYQQSTYPVMHCRQCRYDLCLTCMNQQLWTDRTDRTDSQFRIYQQGFASNRSVYGPPICMQETQLLTFSN